jgi:outer membrane protein OmpA-like peptidoglycan-associated protein
MGSRARLNVTSLLLTGTALLTVGALSSAVHAAPLDAPLVLAQAPAPAPDADKDKEKKPQPPAAQPPAKPQPPAAPPAARPRPPAPPPQAQTPPPAPARPAPSAQTPQPPAAQERRDERREQRREERGNERRPAPPPAAPAAQQQPQPAPSTAQPPAQQQPPAAAQERRDERRDGREQQRPGRDERRDQRRQPEAPAAQQPQPAPAAPPTAQQPQSQPAPSTAQQPQQQRTAPAAAQPQPAPAAPTAQQPAAQPAPAVQSTNPTAVAPPTQTRDAREFLRRDGQGSGRRIDEVRQDRQELRDGNRIIIREADRTIVREGGRTIIRHNEANRFAIGAGNISTQRRGTNFETIVERGNGVRIVTVTDADGRLVRRVRRDGRGADIIIIDNSFASRRGAPVFVQLPPPVIRMPRERYILDADRAGRDDIYEVFMAPPVERLAQRYTLEQVRYSAPLRDRMPRVDLDVTFETGSWELSPEQVDKLAAVAEGLNRALERNPREVFMIEGHTDAVGPDDDNLSLSDRRAEAVAVALTEQFRVPPENLVTQGYGEQYLKVPSDGPERANRRVAVRRITPLIDQQASAAPPPPPRR